MANLSDSEIIQMYIDSLPKFRENYNVSDSEIIQMCIDSLPKLQENYKFTDVTIDKLYDFSNSKIKRNKTTIDVINIFCKRDGYYFKQELSSIRKGRLYEKLRVLTDNNILEICNRSLPKLQEKYEYGNIIELYDFSNVIIKRYKKNIYITNIYCDRDKIYFEQNYNNIKQGNLYRKFITPPDSVFLQKCNDALVDFDYDGDIAELYDFSNATVEIKKSTKNGYYTIIHNIYRDIDKSHFSQPYDSIINKKIYKETFKKSDNEIIKDCIDALLGLQKKYEYGNINELYNFSNAIVGLISGNKRYKDNIIINNIFCKRDESTFSQHYNSILNHSLPKPFSRIPDSIILMQCETYIYNASRYDFSNIIIRRTNKDIFIDNIYCKNCKKYTDNRNYNYIVHQAGTICTCDLNNGNCELYLLKFTSDFDYDFLKIGITNNLKNRLKQFKLYYNIEILNTIKFSDYNELYYYEKSLHKKFKPNYQFFPRLEFGGHKECYTMDLLNNLELRSIFRLDEKIEYYDSNFDITLKLAV